MTTTRLESDRPAELSDAPDQDLLVSARVIIDASGADSGAAALYWAVLSLAAAAS